MKIFPAVAGTLSYMSRINGTLMTYTRFSYYKNHSIYSACSVYCSNDHRYLNGVVII